MATINGIEVAGDKSAHDFGLLDDSDKIEIDNGIERNREAAEDNRADIVRHRTDTEIHVTQAWKNSLVTKEILGLYWTAAQTADIINEISIAGGAKLVKVDELPETGKEQTIYLVPKADPQQGDIFDEFVWIDGKYEFIGTTKVDLSNYATKTELNAKANDVDVVHKSGNETAAGVKTFSDGIVSNLINGKTPDLIEEQGTDYIRYSNGIQMCWGVAKNINSVAAGITQVNFAKAFSEIASVVVGSNQNTNILYYAFQAQNITLTNMQIFCFNVASCEVDIDMATFSWQAIGRWK